VKKQTIVLANILLLIVVTSMYMVAIGQTQETQPKINTTLVSINGSDIKDALTSVHNNTTPNYVKLSENKINEALKRLPGWTILDGKLHKTFTFVDFSTIFEFMYQVADSSQKLNHHPHDINMEYVNFRLRYVEFRTCNFQS
jgi:pterin-4a-carbinolamine dehydratase